MGKEWCHGRPPALLLGYTPSLNQVLAVTSLARLRQLSLLTLTLGLFCPHSGLGGGGQGKRGEDDVSRLVTHPEWSHLWGAATGPGSSSSGSFFFFFINFISQVTQNSDIDKKIKTHTAAIKN